MEPQVDFYHLVAFLFPEQVDGRWSMVDGRVPFGTRLYALYVLSMDYGLSTTNR